MSFRKICIFAIAFILVAVPAVAVFAGARGPGGGAAGPTNTITGQGSNIKDAGGLFTVFCTLMNWIFGFVLVFAVIAFLYGAVNFFLANADEQKVGRARWFMFWGVIGVAVAFLAGSFVYIVGNFVGSSISTIGCQ